MCTHETLEFTLNGPSPGTPGGSDPGVPFALPGPFQMPGLGRLGQTSALRMEMCFILLNLFL